MPRIVTRSHSSANYQALLASGMSPVMARLFAARGIENPAQLGTDLSQLIKPEAMRGIGEATRLLADAILAGKKLLIVADYDADGATACAVGIRALRAMGGRVDYLVPNRFEFGYGLTPEIVRLAGQRRPDILITVDNGIASVDGVAEANGLGMQVIVTDHHLPGDVLPEAAAIVNPNQPGCDFPSKQLAGVGVIFYLMLALRAELRRRGVFDRKSPLAPLFQRGGNDVADSLLSQRAVQTDSPLVQRGYQRVSPLCKRGAGGDLTEPNLADLLDIVALGTVADVVKLDDNNRRLVAQGLARIRAGRACAGIRALMRVAGRECGRAGSYDLGFMLGPRLNAAGRLADISLGIECLITDDEQRAGTIAGQLDALNRERREIEADMQQSALAKLDDIDPRDNFTLSLFEPDWHQGVIGILASRLKDRFHRPAIVFARGQDGTLKGSGRSIAALHLRDALDLVSKRHPGLITKFGGHAAAAGLTIDEAALPEFTDAFETITRGLLSPADLTQIIETDGDLAADEMTLQLAESIAGVVWGQGFPPPRFEGIFAVEQQRVVGEKHLKLKLKRDTLSFDAIRFFEDATLPTIARFVYRPEVNEYNGNRRLQLIIEHWEACQPESKH